MKKIITILFLLISLPSFLWAELPQAFVLCYHTFLGKSTVSTDFSLSEFKSHIQTLKSAGFKFVSWSDILTHKIKGTHNILLVIDDGNRSTYWAYTQVLKPLGIKPMIAIYPGIIGSRKFAMTWESVQEMSQAGCEVASHGYFHQYLSEKYSQEHPAEFRDEIIKSRHILQTKLSKPIYELVYPFGVTSSVAIQMMKTEGYRYAFSLCQKPLTDLEIKQNPFELPRWMMTRSNAKSILAHIQKESH